MDNLITWKAVFWDFDGVVLDSVNVKTEAFAQMFRQYGPEIEKAVVDYHLANGGISRFKKFRYYYEKMLGIPVNQNELIRLGNEFSRLVVQKVIDSPFINGAQETLGILKNQEIPCYVVSGTPEEEIIFIIESKALKHFFTEIHGAPKTKSAILEDILYRKKYPPGNCLYLGDAITDYDAATKAGVFFHGIVSDKNNSPFPKDVPVELRIFI